ncbi:serine protease [Kitasatospora sp. NPDC085879]|uniref:serine protease n=1 Tax=Kitasatospora sp. NPDC085879 TaxID=3154769 RepID=UPI003435008F
MAGRHQPGATAGPPPPRPADALVGIRDETGRHRGLGFTADLQGTVVTAHETAAGPAALVLLLPDGTLVPLGPDAVELLPEHGLALLHPAAAGPPRPALPISGHTGRAAAGRPLALLRPPAAGTAPGPVTPVAAVGRCTAALLLPEGFHAVPDTLLLDLPPEAALPGTPVLDADSGAVLAVLAPALRAEGAGTVPAAPLGVAGLHRLVRRNAESVPGHGAALNLGGVLRLAAVQLDTAAGPSRAAELAAAPATGLAAGRTDRADGLTGEEPLDPHTVLVGAPGSGRSTELAALVRRRATGERPLPTLWLRGADLAPGDTSLAEPVARALAGAATRLAVPAPAPEEAARLCADADRTLLVLLDAPEEAVAAPSGAWWAATGDWLVRHRVRLLTACRPETWDGPARPAGARPVGLGPLPADAAERAARRHGADPAALAPADAAHPEALRTAGDLRAAGLHGTPGGRGELYAAHLDLLCLRIARRIRAAEDRRPGAHRRGAAPSGGEDIGRLRRTAAAVAGRVHEAARLLLGAGHAGLTAGEFDRLFPAAGGWSQAVLAEGLFVRAGDGFRLAREDHADWLQGRHLDLDRALHLLLDPAPAPGPDTRTDRDTDPGAGHGVPRHRLGAVAAALRRLAETGDGPALAERLWQLRNTLDTAEPGSEAAWWAARLLAAVLPALPRPGAHRALLAGLAGHPAFTPDWWAALPLAPADRLDLLRGLVRTDPPGGPYRAAAAALLTADPVTVQPLLCAWFADAGPLADGTGATVADLAHDLLHTHRRLAVDELADTLAAAAHPRADALLARLAEDEPSALCRAVDRWSHDPRPERHVAAAVHALRAAPHANPAGRRLLRFTALTLLAREDEPALHGAALALLLRDPEDRAAHLPRALEAYAADDPFLGAAELAPALADHPEAVLDAVRRRLARPAAPVADGLRLLARAEDPGTVREGILLAARQLREHPERAGQLAAHVDVLLAAGHDARPLVAEVVTAPATVRKVFAPVLAAPDGQARAALLDALLAAERDPGVLAAVLDRVADGCARTAPQRARELVRRIAGRWPGADAALVGAAGRTASFARLLADWPDTGPPPPDGPLTARLRELAAAGRDPQYAAAEAERAAHRAEAIPVPKQGRAHGTL